MLSPSPPRKDATSFHPSSPADDNLSALKFISELGRSLLFTVHPKKVATRVAAAVQSAVAAETCAFVAELENIGLISCAFSSGGEMISGFLRRARFDQWLALLPPQVAYSETSDDEFLVGDEGHALEYVSPIHINGETRGAIITTFANEHDLTEQRARLIDAATQMAAMSINLSAHYGTELNNSITEARAEHRKFTEAVLDALPVSLYVVDRDYRPRLSHRDVEPPSRGRRARVAARCGDRA